MPSQAPQALGELLVERGLLSAEHLARAVQLKEEHGGALPLNLVLAGALDDLTLAAFYQRHLDLPRVADHELDAIPERVFALLPRELILAQGLLPLTLDPHGRLVVGVVDPSGADVAGELPRTLQRPVALRLLSLGQLTRHLQRLAGVRWRVEPATLLARRRAREGQGLILSDAVQALLLQAQELDRRLEALWEFDEDAPPESKAAIKLISVADGQAPLEETVELTYRRPAPAPTQPGAPPRGRTETRVIAPTRGGNRWYLDPVERGEVKMQSRPTLVARQEALPSIVVDDALLDPAPSGIGQPIAIPIAPPPDPLIDEPEDEDVILLTTKNIKPPLAAPTHLVAAPEPTPELLSVEIVIPEEAPDEEVHVEIDLGAFDEPEEEGADPDGHRDTLLFTPRVTAPAPAPATQIIPDSPLDQMDFPEELEEIDPHVPSRDTLQIPALSQRLAEQDRPALAPTPAPAPRVIERKPLPESLSSSDQWLDASFMDILDVEVDEMEPVVDPLSAALVETMAAPPSRPELTGVGDSAEHLRTPVVPSARSEQDESALERLSRARRRRAMARPDPRSGAAERPDATVNGIPGLSASALDRWRGRQAEPEPDPEPIPAPNAYAAPRPGARIFRSATPTSEPAPTPTPIARVPLTPGRLRFRGEDETPEAPRRATLQGLSPDDMALLQRAAPRTPGEIFHLDEPEVEVPARLARLVSGLEAAEDRDQAGRIILDYLSDHHQRVALWTLRGLEASLWMERGLPGAPRDLSLQIGAVDCLMRANTERACYAGPPFEGGPEHDDPLARADAARFRALLGGALPRSALVAPFSIRGRVIGLIYCDDGPDRAIRVDRVALTFLHSYLEEALQRIIILRKRRHQSEDL